jgi:hypothetical protein
MPSDIATAIMDVLRQAKEPISTYELIDRLAQGRMKLPIQVVMKFLVEDLQGRVVRRGKQWQLKESTTVTP